MLDELVTTTHRDTKGAQHALALAQVRLSVLFVLNIHIESFTFKEDFQICVMLKNWVASNLVQHPL